MLLPPKHKPINLIDWFLYNQVEKMSLVAQKGRLLVSENIMENDVITDKQFL